ncbi:PREDICTED: prokineticin receptor 1-like [Branchiostoma belcheri]|uniref:Prokineticin receptor 1-like n=1 Tax=Branchiostoma belcheri TaxID=7741 RepID=A0A6P5AYG0_BRABE|nr:PREDICTED: prokineticin receptor 1-like [Branchiostoma belcheri]
MNASNTSGAPLTECDYNSTNVTDMALYYGDCEYPLTDYPSTETDAEVSIGLKVFLGIVYCLIVMTCGFGNLLLISVIVWFKKARTMTNTLIANLALSDFLVAVFCLPFNLDYYIIKSRMWTHSHVTCVAVHFLRQTSLYVSTNALLVIAIDRYKAYYLSMLVLEFVIPVIIMTFCYVFIVRKIWKRQVPGFRTDEQNQSIMRSKRRSVRLLVVVLVLFVLCWGPYYGYSIARDYFPYIWSKNKLNLPIFYVVEALAMGNSMINTVVYIAMNDSIKKYIKKIPRSCKAAWDARQNRKVAPANGRRRGDAEMNARKNPLLISTIFRPVRVDAFVQESRSTHV